MKKELIIPIALTILIVFFIIFFSLSSVLKPNEEIIEQPEGRITICQYGQCHNGEVIKLFENCVLLDEKKVFCGSFSIYINE